MGGSASRQAGTRVNAGQASKRMMLEPTPANQRKADGGSRRERHEHRSASTGAVAPACMEDERRGNTGSVRRVWLLNLRVEVPPAQFPVWRRSISLRVSGRPGVRKQGRRSRRGPVGTQCPAGPGQSGRRASRRAAAKANDCLKRRNAAPATKLICGGLGDAKGLLPARWPASMRKNRGARIGSPGAGTAAIRESSAVKDWRGGRTGCCDPRMSRTAPATASAGSGAEFS